MTRILVAYATRTGYTREIADTIADVLDRVGHDVVVRPCSKAPSSYHFDAVMVGSAVYSGRWLPQAMQYLDDEAPDLAERPTWLFQTRHRTEHAAQVSTDTPRAVRQLAATLDLSLPTTLSTDLRDRETVESWARQVGRELDRGRWSPSEAGSSPRAAHAGLVGVE